MQRVLRWLNPPALYLTSNVNLEEKNHITGEYQAPSFPPGATTAAFWTELFKNHLSNIKKDVKCK